MDSIYKRKSFNTFNENQIETKLLIDITSAGMYTPNSKDKFPWEFILLANKEKISLVTSEYKNWQTIMSANKLIVICGNLELDNRKEQLIMTCAAATQNILLRATELGVASHWVGVYPNEERIQFLAKVLSLPEYVIPIALVGLGYSDEEFKRNKQSFPQKIHFDKW